MYAATSITRAITGITTAIKIAAVEFNLVDACDVDAVGDGVEGAPIDKDGIDGPVGDIIEIVHVGNDVEFATRMTQAFNVAGDTNPTPSVNVAPPLVERVIERLVIEGAVQLQKAAKTSERVAGSTQERR
ncbi:hypothetical protein OIDMADRAFT_46789 [Oidiodendron maius Zn]|uniref:Uncharacterized protein n=1 Tax=Oidiodendron maius (strain Zn) TaxID=913774 RepID=A0A0C3HV35_OIDMZ|nr:hypothetical protein OIDMADRAFT_46789 [Oidiodendron maius Zn]